MTIRERLAALVKQNVADGTWEVVAAQPMVSCRWTKEEVTPDWAREGSNPSWPGETYSRMVFLTFIGQGANGSIVMRVCAAPWVRCQDSQPPLWLVEEVLKDPELAFDITRILAMRMSRRAGREVTSRGVIRG